jgi:hypothetical protein
MNYDRHDQGGLAGRPSLCQLSPLGAKSKISSVRGESWLWWPDHPAPSVPSLGVLNSHGERHDQGDLALPTSETGRSWSRWTPRLSPSGSWRDHWERLTLIVYRPGQGDYRYGCQCPEKSPSPFVSCLLNSERRTSWSRWTTWRKKATFQCLLADL